MEFELAMTRIPNEKIGPSIMQEVQQAQAQRLAKERAERKAKRDKLAKRSVSRAELLYQSPGNFSPSPQQEEQWRERYRRLENKPAHRFSMTHDKRDIVKLSRKLKLVK